MSLTPLTPNARAVLDRITHTGDSYYLTPYPEQKEIDESITEQLDNLSNIALYLIDELNDANGTVALLIFKSIIADSDLGKMYNYHMRDYSTGEEVMLQKIDEELTKLNISDDLIKELLK